VTSWIFDLDNTLYPPECNLFAQVDKRMGAFIRDHFGVDEETARRIQKSYFLDYGTTLKGLMDRRGVDPDDFLAAVHDIDISPLRPDPALAEAIARLDGRKLVFTNAPADYAERVLERLGIAPLFDGLYDIAAAGFTPKPMRETYDRFVARHGVTPGEAVMVEDMARNLVPAAELGMTTVWLRNSYAWGDVGHEPEHVHHEIDDLAAFLLNWHEAVLR